MGRTKQYNTLSDDDSIQFTGTSHSRWDKKEKRRRCCACIMGSVILLILVGVVVAVVLVVIAEKITKDKCSIDPSNRINCIPEGGASEDLCNERGCCWVASNTPQCFYPSGFGYEVNGSVKPTDYGFQVDLKLKSNQTSPYGNDSKNVRVDVMFETQNRLRIKMYDPNSERYEVPIATPPVGSKAKNPNYDVTFEKDTFSFTVSRSTPKKNLFSMAEGLIFSDQFLQLAAFIPSHNIYGLGEHVTGLRLDTNRTVLTLFSRDIPPNPDFPSTNLYGVHPLYLCLEEDGNAHGVFLLNSNAMEIELLPAPGITYRTIGGILDLYFLLGPSPEAVVQQYTEIVGHPFMPPYWSLGFHLCRWGYNSSENTQAVVQRMRDKKIPQDTQWNDIDYMHDKLDFTYDNATYAGLPDLVEDLHSNGQRYVIIIDPGISNEASEDPYPPFDDGVALGIFIANSSGDPIIGQVWPGTTAFPDFTNPLAETYWENEIRKFRSSVEFDGLWIDMNEPSNFVPGSLEGCPNSTYNSPPFLPGVIRTLNSGIIEKTLCMTAEQNVSTHYNVHSLYGHTEANATMRALTQILNKRSLVISRSTYPGTGVHGGHWLGDNSAEWRHMVNSIPGILDFSIFGIPLVGADICGFFGDTTEQLCTRWQQLGAFYPFSRNHNTIGTRDQDPAVWSNTTVDIMRDALLLRYKLLPFLYTLFYSAHVDATTVARPLFFEFPTDNQTWGLDQQFMWGSALLITPVLTENASSVRAYFPKARWFDLRNGSEVSGTGAHVTLEVTMETIPLHVRGGSIIPMQEPSTTTNASRGNPFSLLVALNATAGACGQLFLDDGESLDTIENEHYTLLNIMADKGTLTSTVEHSGYSGATEATLNNILIYGLAAKPNSVSVNNATLPAGDVTWNGSTKSLNTTVSITNLNKPFTMSWK